MDVPAPGVGAVCGACPLGYTGDSLKCYGRYVYTVAITCDHFPLQTSMSVLIIQHFVIKYV